MKVLLNNQTYINFTEYGIDLYYNAIASTFAFTSLSDIIVNPFGYDEVKIFDDNDNLLITGTVTGFNKFDTIKPTLTAFGGYSLTGILDDVSVPYPLQTDGLSLQKIAEKLLKKFDIKMVVDTLATALMNKTFKKSTASDSQSVANYLTELAAQKGLVITHNSNGELLFTKVNFSTKKTYAYFDNSQEIEMSINAQGMHSDIKVVRQASKDNENAGEFDIKNPYVTKYRPVTRSLSSGDIYSLKEAARYELGKELMNINFSISGTKNFILAGEVVEIKSDRLGIKKYTKCIVISSSIKGSAKTETYDLKLQLLDCFSTDPVKNIFL